MLHHFLSLRLASLPLCAAVDQELQRMVKQNVIRKVDEPTDWCAGMVVVPKTDGRMRLCGDYTNLNLSVQRERHILPSIEHLLANVSGARYFSKLDANTGFHQIALDPESHLLTTFITPSGRYCYKRLPFGISSAPEHFQKRMAALLDGCEGVIVMMDDVLIFGDTPESHNQRLSNVLQKLLAAGTTLNKGKCVFGQEQVRFCGYLIDAAGIRPDPGCQSVSDVRRFLGMANQLGQFSPQLASLSVNLSASCSSKATAGAGTPRSKLHLSASRRSSVARRRSLYTRQTRRVSQPTLRPLAWARSSRRNNRRASGDPSLSSRAR